MQKSRLVSQKPTLLFFIIQGRGGGSRLIQYKDVRLGAARKTRRRNDDVVVVWASHEKVIQLDGSARSKRRDRTRSHVRFLPLGDARESCGYE